MTNNNPPTVEFVMDALRVARATTSASRAAWHTDATQRICDCVHCDALDDFEAKIDPPTVIALMEDWLRLREALEQVRDDSRTPAEIKIWCGAALTKQG